MADIHECGCCCSDVNFQELVQCVEGHLFCFTCLQKRIEESTFGVIPAWKPLYCIHMQGCDKLIPWSEIRRAVNKEILIHFEERQASDGLAHAKLQGLFYCPICNLACQVDPDVTVFKCPNKECQKETCIKCKQPSHLPEECPKIPKELVEDAWEETMSKNVICHCTVCKVPLVKKGGCNKITCRCGHHMCYVCRQPIKNYDHFCEHFRSTGKPCKYCNKCNLYQKVEPHEEYPDKKRTEHY